MPRKQTATSERQAQRAKVKAIVERELGHPVTHAEAAAHRRSQGITRGQPVKPAIKVATAVTHLGDHLVPDGTVDFADDELSLVGRMLGMVVAGRLTRTYVELTIQGPPNFGHMVQDAVSLSGHSLQITLHEINPAEDDVDVDWEVG